MDKYNLISEQLVHEGTISSSSLIHPAILTEEKILLTHSPDWWAKLRDQQLCEREQRRIGFPQSPTLTLRETHICSGTWQAAKIARSEGVALNVSGGTHHAFRSYAEGFCLLNDIALAANLLLHHHLAAKILIVDLDVHQGNGTAEIFQNDSRVFTFSMHCEVNYPPQKEFSDLDIGLKAGTDDTAYLRVLHETLPRLIDEVQPDFAFYLSGVDILETDRYGKLKVTRQGSRLRDRFVFETLKRNRIPVAVSMGGGYSPHIRDIVEAHCNTFREAADVWG